MAIKILVLEDHIALLEVISDVLEARGFDVEGTTNGRVGLDLATKHIPDVIVSDYYLRERNGLEVLEGIRSNPSTAHTPFIMVSMEGASWLQEKAMKEGASAFLVKPYSLQELIQTIEQLRSKRSK